MNFNSDLKNELDTLMQRWEVLHDTPNIFSYKLCVLNSKYLSGPHKLYSELNPDRTTLRRPPQLISNLNPEFDEDGFNFEKIKEQELILAINYKKMNVSMIINKSPLTLYHTLICPNMSARLPQKMTIGALNFAVDLLQQAQDSSFRVGYNSPGALASVNHLHLHLVHIVSDLYIDTADLVHIKDEYVYRLHPDLPTEAICIIFRKEDAPDEFRMKLKTAYKFLMFLCDENLPHNLFITQSRDYGTEEVRVFVFAREKYCLIKDASEFNLGFCELAGYLPVGKETIFDDLSEKEVFSKIRLETGNVFNKIYDYFKDVHNPRECSD